MHPARFPPKRGPKRDKRCASGMKYLFAVGRGPLSVVHTNQKERRYAMKRVWGIIAAVLILCSSIVYAAGGQECGDKAQGNAGSTGNGDVTQNHAPNP